MIVYIRKLCTKILVRNHLKFKTEKLNNYNWTIRIMLFFFLKIKTLKIFKKKLNYIFCVSGIARGHKVLRI